MQVIKPEQAKLYECPLKFVSWNCTGPCTGPKCKWWAYASNTSFAKFPAPPSKEIDKNSGYCGK